MIAALEWEYLPLRVGEDDGLGDGERVIQVAQSVELPLLTLHSHEELLDALSDRRAHTQLKESG